MPLLLPPINVSFNRFGGWEVTITTSKRSQPNFFSGNGCSRPPALSFEHEREEDKPVASVHISHLVETVAACGMTGGDDLAGLFSFMAVAQDATSL